MENELKPCPFCGGKNIKLNEANRLNENRTQTRTYYYVWCSDCTAQGAYCRTKSKAISAWNGRCRDGT